MGACGKLREPVFRTIFGQNRNTNKEALDGIPKNSEIGEIRSFTVSPNGLFFFFFLLFFIKKLFQNIDRSVLPKQNKMILFCTRNLRWSGDNKHPTRPHTILKKKWRTFLGFCIF